MIILYNFRGGANPGTIKDIYNPGMRNLADWLKTLRSKI